MRLDGDPIWDHDEECSLLHPCAACEREEEERADAEWDENERRIDHERGRDRVDYEPDIFGPEECPF